MTVGPIQDDELEVIFQRLERFDRLMLAVSGGPDSMSLMHLVSRWRTKPNRASPDIIVATVNHGLRPEAGEESAFVGTVAQRLGFAHEMLQWIGPHPESGLQAAARTARYELLTQRARDQSCPVILTAHHLEDQAETLLMRLARGGGVDGLSAMADEVCLNGVVIQRPLLNVCKARLIATLQEIEEEWCHDCSNDDIAFERVRIRKAAPMLRELGLTANQIARTATRLRRARNALEARTSAFLSIVPNLERDLMTGGFVAVPRDIYDGEAEDIRLRAMARILVTVSGRKRPRMAKLEALIEALSKSSNGAWTLASCAIVAKDQRLLVFRETGRRGVSTIDLRPGEHVIWDRRFQVSWDSRLTDAIQVGPLSDDLSTVRAFGCPLPAVPKTAALSLPAFRAEGTLFAVPHLNYFSNQCINGDRSYRGLAVASFANMTKLSIRAVDGSPRTKEDD